MSDWIDTGCGGWRYRQSAEGFYDIEPFGIVQKSLPAGVITWAPTIVAAAQTAGIDPNLALGVTAFESGGKPEAGSPVGAQGLMQVMPQTAAGLGEPGANLHDPATNARLGCKLLARLMKAQGGNVVRVLFAYNAGGPRCGGGISHGIPHAEDKGTPCAPNGWNLVADCYDSSLGTVDYATPVLDFANAALSMGLVESVASQGQSGGGAPSSFGWLELAGAVGLGVLAVVAVRTGPVIVSRLEQRHRAA